jgi:Zn-dependent protease
VTTPPAPAVAPAVAAPSGVRLGRVLGAPVVLRPSWLAVAIAVTVVFAPTAARTAPGAAALAVGLAFTVLLLASVLLHEIGHAVAAGFSGNAPTAIVLDVWGGHTTFEGASVSPGRSAAVAASGPVVNAVVAASAWWAYATAEPSGVPALLLLATSVANALVAGFNLLPGLPLDGGRLLEAGLWAALGDRPRAAVASAWSGRVLAVGVLACAAMVTVASQRRASLVTGLWLLAAAVLLWQGSGQALRAARWALQVPRATADALMVLAAPVSAGSDLATAARAAAETDAGVVVLLDVDGRPAAWATAPDPGRAGTGAVADIARELAPGAVLSASLAGEELLRRMRDVPADQYAVVDDAGRPVGVLDWEDVAAFVSGRRKPA